MKTLERGIGSFSYSGTTRNLATTVEVVRVGFGLAVLHQSLDIYGFALLSSEPAFLATTTLIAALLGLLVAAGALTSLALLGFLALVTLAPPVGYLGMQVARLVAFGLLLLDAGQAAGLGALVRKRMRRGSGLEARLSFGERSPAALARTRLLLVALYWTVAFSGIRFHLEDPFWHRGDVLQLALTTPYLTDHYAFFETVRDRAPVLYDRVLTLGLGVQAAWQSLLLLLFLPRWRILQAFAVLQGLAFFLVSLFVLNLGYLGVFELLLWMLLFGYRPFFGLGSASDTTPAPAPERPALAHRLVLGLGAAAFFLFLLQSVAGLLHPSLGSVLRAGVRASGLQELLRLFGQQSVNVFNREDLTMGAAHVVVVETDETGRPLRVVPFQDTNGGRLDYLRNDYLYFQRSLKWQRLPATAKFLLGDPGRPAPATLELVEGVVDLDVCLTGGRAPRHYEAFVLVRDLEEGPLFPLWSAPRRGGRFTVRVGKGREREIAARASAPFGLGRCFSLPPGQARSEARLAATLAWARAAAPPEP
jgi:hypothetical protein